MSQFFDRLRPRRTVLKRTKPAPDLPKLVLYAEWVQASAQRKVIDEEGKEHLIPDRTLESHYKQVGGGTAKSLIEAHWAEQKAKAQTPIRTAQTTETPKA